MTGWFLLWFLCFQHCLWYLKYQSGCISNRVYGSRHAIIEQGRGVFDNQKPSACSFSCPQQWYVSFGNPVSSKAFSLRYSGATHSTSSFSLKHECYILTQKPSLTVEIKKILYLIFLKHRIVVLLMNGSWQACADAHWQEPRHLPLQSVHLNAHCSASALIGFPD